MPRNSGFEITDLFGLSDDPLELSDRGNFADALDEALVNAGAAVELPQSS
jgi:hypothetical protein